MPHVIRPIDRSAGLEADGVTCRAWTLEGVIWLLPYGVLSWGIVWAAVWAVRAIIWG